MTVRSFVQWWLINAAKPTLRSSSFDAYEAKIRLHILPVIGNVPLNRLTGSAIQSLYARKLEEGLSPSSVSAIHAILHRALRQAVRGRLLSGNPADAVEVPRKQKPTPNPLALSKIPTLLSSITDHRYESLWFLLLSTGIRFGEAAALTWDSIDLESETLTVSRSLSRSTSGGIEFAEPKSASSRRAIPLTRSTTDVLRRQRSRVLESRLLAGGDWREHDLVFPSRRGTPLRENHVLTSFHRELKKAGLKRRRLHDLRHTFATRLFALGLHPRVVQELLGHARINTTMDTYTSSVPRLLREAAQAFDAEIKRAILAS